MKHLDLFTGIGGFSIAAEWAGIETVRFCENNEWCIENVLKRNWPDIPITKDIKNVKGRRIERTIGDIDLITAGVPCQPASLVGRREGRGDDRWLWEEMLRVVREVQPTWVVCENPRGILNLDKGDRFAEVVEGFQNAGYDCWWESIPATSVGAGHHRQRVWVIALASSSRLERQSGGEEASRQPRWFKKKTNRHTPRKLYYQLKIPSRGGLINPQYILWFMGYPTEHFGKIK